jgi:hypothetical protein
MSDGSNATSSNNITRIDDLTTDSDAASITSDDDSPGPFSVSRAEAAIIADAFRKKLRNPDFSSLLIPSGNLTTDAASTTSDGDGPFSGADAAIMADAFRKALRKPDFTSPLIPSGNQTTDDTSTTSDDDTASTSAQCLP